MSKAKRIFVVVDFQEKDPASLRPSRRHWLKGLTRLGHDVQRFSYTDIMKQCALWPNKRWGKKYSKAKVANILIEFVKKFQPDILFFLLIKDFSEETLVKLKEVSGNAIYVGHDSDHTPKALPYHMVVARHLYIMISTGGGTVPQSI